MARHGENIRKRKDGRWEGRYLVYSEAKGRTVYRSVYESSYEAIRKKLAAEKRQKGLEGGAGAGDSAGPGCSAWAGGSAGPGCSARAGDSARLGCSMGFSYGDIPEAGGDLSCLSGRLLFPDLAWEWLAHVKETKKLSTYEKYRLVFQKHLELPFQEVGITEITETFVRERISDSLTDSVTKTIYSILNQILKFSYRQYGIVLPVLQRPMDSGCSRPVRSLSRKEQRLLFAVLTCGKEIFQTAVLLCLYTGLRLGEVCALKWEDVDFSSQMIMVNRTVQRLYMESFRTKTVLWESEPKSAHSRREIPMTDAVQELLLRLMDQEEQGSRSEYIFGRKKPVEPRTMQNHFRKLLKEAGLDGQGIHFHTLRHTFATNCIEGGTDVKSLSELLGHSGVQITLNRYVHPSMDTKRRHLDGLSSFYGQIHGQVGEETLIL